MIEDDALADVRATDDRNHQKGIVGQLWQQLAFEQLKPFASRQRRELQQAALNFQLPHRRVQVLNVFGTGGVGRTHRANSITEAKPEGRTSPDCGESNLRRHALLSHSLASAIQGRPDRIFRDAERGADLAIRLAFQMELSNHIRFAWRQVT